MTAFYFAFLALRAARVRNAFLVLLVAIIVATTLTLFALAGAIENSLQRGSDERGVSVTVAQHNATDLMSSALPQSLLGELSNIPGINGVTGELVSFGTLDSGTQILVFGWNPEGFLWKTVPLTDGALPTPQMRPRQSVLGQGLAKSLGLKVGDQLRILEEAFVVVGISGYESTLNRSTVLMALADLQEITFRENQVSFFQIRFAEQATSALIRNAKEQLESSGRLRAMPIRELLAGDHNFRFFHAVSRAVSIVSLTMGALCVCGAFLIAVNERRRDLAVLLALGWTKSKIFSAVLLEAVILGGFAGVVAIPLALLAGASFQYLPGVGSILAVSFEPLWIMSSIAAAFALSAGGALYPAWNAMRMSPSSTLKAVS